MKKSNQRSVCETVCGIDNPEVASENSATREVQDVLSHDEILPNISDEHDVRSTSLSPASYSS